MLKPGKAITIAVLATTLGGCAVVTSKGLSNKTGSQDALMAGTSYFLPRVDMKLVVKQVQIDAPKLAALKAKKGAADKAVAEAATALGKAKGEMEEAKGAWQQAQSTGNPAAPDLEKDFTKKETAFNKAKAVLAFAQANQNTAANELAAAQVDPKKCQTSVALTTLPAVPDPNFAYVAQLDHSAFRSDDLKVATTAEGLLTTVDMSSEDKIGEIITNLAKVVIAIKKLGAVQSGFTPKGILPGAPPPCPTIDGEIIFDPTSADEVGQAQTLAGKADMTLTVHSTSEISTPAAKVIPAAAATKANVTAPKEQDGLVYRRAIPYKFVIADKQQNTIKSAQVTLPNGGPLAYVPMTAGPFVKTERNVTFSNGMLLSNKETRPSEVLAFTRIPLDILEALIALPAEILQLKFDISSKESALLQKELERIKAQEELRLELERQRKALEEQGTLGETQ